MTGNFLAVTQAELDALYGNPDSVLDVLEMREPETMNIDKAWQGIHFMLTGDPYGGTGPLARAILGGEPVGEEDAGYGPARGMSASEVKETASALHQIPEADFRARFDPDAMSNADIYPGIWDRGDEALDYVTDGFLEVKRFYANAAEKGLAVILFIN